MSLECYDRALKKKLEGVFPNVIFSSLSKALAHSADSEIVTKSSDGDVRVKEKHEQVVAVPLIAFDRINNGLNFEFRGNDAAIRRGRFVIREEEPLLEKQLPINPQYQIDIVSDKRVEVDGIWRELVMFLYTRPEIDVEFDGDNPFVEKFNIKLMDTDNTTDVEDFTNIGRVYRQTLTIEIPQAVLLFQGPANLINQFPIRTIHLDEEEEGEDVQDN